MWSKSAFILKFMLLLCSVAMAAGQVALAGENKALKADLESQLVGKTVVSRILFGGRAVPPGYQADYPVNTLVYPDTGAVTYRVEWGVMRAEVGEREMVRRFESGTSFLVSGIDLKDDRLELKLERGSGGSARLKLMLGRGWQSRLDNASVQAQLARVFVLEQGSEPTHGITVTSASPLSQSGERRDASVSRVDGQASASPGQLAHVHSILTALSSVAAFPTPNELGPPTLTIDNGEKVWPITEEPNGMVKVYTATCEELYVNKLDLVYEAGYDNLHFDSCKQISDWESAGNTGGGSQGHAKALEELHRSASNISPQRMYQYGYRFYWGGQEGGDRNYTKAYLYFELAAEQGLPMAMDYLGLMNHDGQGTPQDYSKAFQWYTKAAEHGLMDAIVNLGVMYEMGQGVPQDYKKAVEWYTKAAAQGNRDGQLELGRMYEKGLGVPQDKTKAVEWYEKAAAQGLKEADNRLALLTVEANAQREKEERESYTVIKVLKSNWVNITTTDDNGYRRAGSGPLQRMVVSLGTATGEHGIVLLGNSYAGGNAAADIVCLGGYDAHGRPNLACPPLDVGSTYSMQLGRLQTHMTPDGAGGYDYKNLPYLSMKKADGSVSAWQILELCHGTDCVAVSTINSR